VYKGGGGVLNSRMKSQACRGLHSTVLTRKGKPDDWMVKRKGWKETLKFNPWRRGCSDELVEARRRRGVPREEVEAH
jgi:hypothetical protein